MLVGFLVRKQRTDGIESRVRLSHSANGLNRRGESIGSLILADGQRMDLVGCLD